MNDKNATRIDYLGEELRKLLDGSQKYGYGILELTASREVILFVSTGNHIDFVWLSFGAFAVNKLKSRFIEMFEL